MPFAPSRPPIRLAALATLLLVAGCGKPTPVYAPPPGGHDALSQPPASLLGK
jgi:predicted small lipoprotein YifL